MRPFARTMPEMLTSTRPSFTYGGDRITSGHCCYSKVRRAQANQSNRDICFNAAEGNLESRRPAEAFEVWEVRGAASVRRG